MCSLWIPLRQANGAFGLGLIAKLSWLAHFSWCHQENIGVVLNPHSSFCISTSGTFSVAKVSGRKQVVDVNQREHGDRAN